MKHIFALAAGLLLSSFSSSVLAQSEPQSQEMLEELLPQELKRLESALGGRMGVALFRTDDPTVQAFIAGGILRVPQEAYLRLETGLAAVAVLEGKHNNQKRAMCYVLFHPQRAEAAAKRAFFDPISVATKDARQGAAFLAAHEVAHCLDHLERETLLAKHMRWNSEQANQVGIQPYAFTRIFGSTAATAAYRSRLNELYSDLAQRQYEERVADAFGVLWVWRMGGSQQVLEKVVEVRGRSAPHSSHATAPVLASLQDLKGALAQARDIDAVWALARQTQRQVGVDPSLGLGSTVAANPISTAIKESQQRARQKSPSTPTAPKSRAWNELPRFGGQ